MFSAAIKAAFQEFYIGRDCLPNKHTLVATCSACRLMQFATGESADEAAECLIDYISRHVCANANPTR